MAGTVHQSGGKHTQLARVQLCSLTATQQNSFYFVSLSLECFSTLNFDNKAMKKGIQIAAVGDGVVHVVMACGAVLCA